MAGLLSGINAALNHAGTPLPSAATSGAGSAGGASKRLIGNWGIDIIFRVGLEEMLTFQNGRKRVAARYAQHDLVGNVPRLEWLGAGVTELTLEVFLSVDLGIHVNNVLKTIENAVRMGKKNELWIGGKKVGVNKWIIESMEQDWVRHYSDGLITAARNTLTFREYYEGAS